MPGVSVPSWSSVRLHGRPNRFHERADHTSGRTRGQVAGTENTVGIYEFAEESAPGVEMDVGCGGSGVQARADQAREIGIRPENTKRNLYEWAQ